MAQTHKQKYVQEYILRLIANGMKCGDILPSIPKLALRLSVSRMTVFRTIEQLEQMGAVVRKQGKGIFVGNYELFQDKLPEYKTQIVDGKSVITFLSPFIHSTHFMEQLTEGVETALIDDAHTVFKRHFYVGKTHEEEELADAAEKSAGIIMISSYPPAMRHVLHKLIKNRYPLVLLDRWPEEMQCNCVSMENADAVFRLMEEFYKNGHRDIVFYCSDSHVMGYSSTAARIQAYRAFMQNKGLTPFVFKSKTSFLSHIERDPKDLPTGVLANNSDMAYELCVNLETRGIKIPQRISLAGIDDLPAPENINTKLTLIRQPKFQMGYQAGVMLKKLLSRQEETFTKLMVMGTFVKGNSIKKLNGGS
jgi:DNA-binding LacI/PurR family transcriptional regulator